MKKLFFWVLILAFLTAGCAHGHHPVPGAGNVDDVILTDELVVVLHPGYKKDVVESAFANYDLELRSKHSRDGETAWKVSFNTDAVRADKLLVDLAEHPAVKEANFVMRDKHH